MEGDGNDSGAVLGTDEDDTRSAVNELILDYYKKFGRKRDLEQYFSLSTAQNDLRDPTGSFWRKMKAQDDSSDSGEKKSESSQELCRISIRCSLPDPSSSQDENTKTKSYSESPPKSPPIIVDDGVEDVKKNSDEEYDDNHSQKSFDILDTSMNPRSPTSSITSQRKLEWDSLADVGYANESDRKNSASSLSTLEKLALKQQYSNNDTEKASQFGVPTAQSTPLDDIDIKSKSKKGLAKKTKIYKKDVDFVEFNIPQCKDNPSQSINVNMTKHISFNVQKDGGVTVENIKNDINVNSPEKASGETESASQAHIDKEIQTSAVKTTDKAVNSDISKKDIPQKVPIMISLNTLRKRNRRKKLRNPRKHLNSKRKTYCEKGKEHVQDKSGEQLSEADSFEYMPGHVYNQNHLKLNQPKLDTAGNKSSLESSGGLPTTDSSKSSKHSFKKDLEKSIDLLRIALQERCNDDNLKKKLIKEVIQRLLSSTYRDDETTTDFLSGLSFKSNKIGLGDSNQTTSTSDGNTLDKAIIRPKKSILRMDKFNSNAIASTSQSAPNLPVASNSDKPCTSKLIKSLILSNTDTDASSREKMSSDNGFAKTSSEELYQKYLQAVKKEEAYRKHLREKEILLKKKLRSSDTVFKVPPQLEKKVNNRMKELMKDLTRNNYDDGSGDASKLEGSSNYGFERINRSQSHSVFTLSSGQSENQSKKQTQNKRLQGDVKNLDKAGPSKRDHYCCCPHHSVNLRGVTDSSVQVNIRDPSPEKSKNQFDTKSLCAQRSHLEPGRNVAHFVSDTLTGDVKYVCLCNNKAVAEEVPDNYLIYKCSRLTNRGVQSEDISYSPPNVNATETENHSKPGKTIDHLYQGPPLDGNLNQRALSVDSNISDNIPIKKPSKSSQTNLFLKMLCGKSSDQSMESPRSHKNGTNRKIKASTEIHKTKFVVHEATRCLQTEISINPKISDPHLSDINIMSDRDCFKLVSEQHRELSRHSSDTDSRNREVQSDVEGCTSNENIRQCSSKDSNTCLGTDLQKVQSQTNNIGHRNQSDIQLTSDNFTIPIQGTNMMLMVKIGSNTPTPEIKQNELVSHAIETEKLYNIDKSTSLIEECSKAVQNDPTANDDTDYNKNKVTAKEVKYPLKGPFVVNVSEVPKNKFSTYPKEDRKPFLRSNTNTDIVESDNLSDDEFNTNVESRDTIRNFDKFSIENKDIKSHKVQNNLYLDPLCPCGCSLRNCEGSCGKDKENNNTIDPIATGIEYSPTDVSLNLQPVDSSPRNEDIIETFSRDKYYHSVSMRSDEQNNANKKDIGIQKDLQSEPQKPVEIKDNTVINMPVISSVYSENLKSYDKSDLQSDNGRLKSNSANHYTKINNVGKTQQADTDTDGGQFVHNSDKETDRNYINIASSTEVAAADHQDPVLNMIKDITKRYSKTEIEKNKRKKCFKEIVTVLNYLLDTDDSSDNKEITKDCGNCSSKSKESDTEYVKVQETISDPQSAKEPKTETHCVSCQTKILIDKAVQLTIKKKKPEKPITETSDLPTSTDAPETSTDSATCRVLNKIKKECERYHQKRCKSYSGKICEASISTSANCEKCRRVHHCSCRNHKCKRPKSEKPKKPVAYNLIIQTSESMISEETVCNEECRTLKNIVVKVPSRYKKLEKAPFKEVACKIEQKMTMTQSPRCDKNHRSRSLPNEYEMSSSGDLRAGAACTIRDYLEKNRPDFVENCSQRQNCLKYVSESRANERAAHRDLLSMHVDRESPLSALSLCELRHLAKEIGVDASAHKLSEPTLISEKEMKKRSEKIYKSLPEVVKKKEQLKNENIKRNNLLMANIFKKNLQKKTLRGSVNLSNYSTVIKI